MRFLEFYSQKNSMLDNPNFVKWFGDSKIKFQDGTPIRLYHETKAKNVEGIKYKGFDVSMVGSREAEEVLPNGIYMKPHGDSIGVGGGDEESVQIPLYAKIVNPLIVDDRRKMQIYLSQSKEYEEIISELRLVDREMKQKFDTLWNEKSDKDSYDRSKLLNKSKKLKEITTEWGKLIAELSKKAREIATDVIKQDGYDGVIVHNDEGSFGRKTKTYIAFEPNQVKSAIGNKGSFKSDSNNIHESNFNSWFNGSKIIDSTGKPLVVYHGSNNKFDKFDKSKLGSANGKTPTNMKGFFFSDNKEVGQSFGKYLIKAYLNIKNPKIIDAKGKNYSDFKHKLNDIIDSLDNQYDGLIIKNYVDSMEDTPQKSTQYVAFDPKQIKIIKEESVDEMAAPSDAHFSTTYYHGTSTAKSARGIFEKGIQPPDLSSRKGKLRPVEGKVYITPSIEYGTIYALGANMLGHDMTSFLNNKEDRYGYLFVIDGKELKDIQPDEDNVGEFIYNCLTKEDYTTKNQLYWLVNLAKSKLTPKQLQNIKWGEYDEFAHAGKKLMKYLSDSNKLQLIDLGAHIAHHGAIIPKEVWRIDKMDSSKLKKDGSNFFDIANKINSVEEII